MSRHIILNDGTLVEVDSEDFPELVKYKWCNGGKGYAVRREYQGNGKYKSIIMHRYLMGAKKGEVVDHKNRIKEDNRKENLRICSRSQNATNSKNRENSTGYRGVSYDKRRRRYNSEIRVCPGKREYLGSFDCAIEAAKAYDEAALRYHGEFASLNFEKGDDR